jgi:two-component system cell cycle response regulator DivK
VSKRVLVVEDDLLNRMYLCAVLEGSGFVADSVSDGAHVVEAARRSRPDLITMDINLPNVSGLELIKRLRADADLKQIPICAVTAYVGKGEENRIRKAGADDFMAKPISMNALLGTVNRLLSRNETEIGPAIESQDSSQAGL